MSLKTRFGNLQDILSPNPYEENVFVIDSPFITNGLFKKISARGQESTTVIDCTVHKDNFNLKEEIKRIQFESETAVLSGKSHIVLSDISADHDKLSLPMILITAAVHTDLTRKGIRSFVSLHVRSAECLDTHYFAVLIGVGATTVNPYLALDCIYERQQKGLLEIYLTRNVLSDIKKQ